MRLQREDGVSRFLLLPLEGPPVEYSGARAAEDAWAKLTFGIPIRGLAQDLVMKGNVPHSRVLAAPVSTAFRSTPTPRCQPIGVTSWSA
jgi:hypothetical protein